MHAGILPRVAPNTFSWVLVLCASLTLELTLSHTTPRVIILPPQLSSFCIVFLSPPLIQTPLFFLLNNLRCLKRKSPKSTWTNLPQTDDLVEKDSSENHLAVSVGEATEAEPLECEAAKDSGDPPPDNSNSEKLFETEIVDEKYLQQEDCEKINTEAKDQPENLQVPVGTEESTSTNPEVESVEPAEPIVDQTGDVDTQGDVRDSITPEPENLAPEQPDTPVEEIQESGSDKAIQEPQIPTVTELTEGAKAEAALDNTQAEESSILPEQEVVRESTENTKSDETASELISDLTTESTIIEDQPSSQADISGNSETISESTKSAPAEPKLEEQVTPPSFETQVTENIEANDAQDPGLDPSEIPETSQPEASKMPKAEQEAVADDGPQTEGNPNDNLELKALEEPIEPSGEGQLPDAQDAAPEILGVSANPDIESMVESKPVEIDAEAAEPRETEQGEGNEEPQTEQGGGSENISALEPTMVESSPEPALEQGREREENVGQVKETTLENQSTDPLLQAEKAETSPRLENEKLDKSTEPEDLPTVDLCECGNQENEPNIGEGDTRDSPRMVEPLTEQSNEESPGVVTQVAGQESVDEPLAPEPQKEQEVTETSALKTPAELEQTEPEAKIEPEAVEAPTEESPVEMAIEPQAPQIAEEPKQEEGNLPAVEDIEVPVVEEVVRDTKQEDAHEEPEKQEEIQEESKQDEAREEPKQESVPEEPQQAEAQEELNQENVPDEPKQAEAQEELIQEDVPEEPNQEDVRKEPRQEEIQAEQEVTAVPEAAQEVLPVKPEQEEASAPKEIESATQEGPQDDPPPPSTPLNESAVVDEPAPEESPASPSKEKRRRRHSHSQHDSKHRSHRRRESNSSNQERPALNTFAMMAAAKFGGSARKRRDSMTSKDDTGRGKGKAREHVKDDEREKSSSKEREHRERSHRHRERGDDKENKRRVLEAKEAEIERRKRHETRRAEKERPAREEEEAAEEERRQRREEHRAAKKAEAERLQQLENERIAKDEERRIRHEERRKRHEAEKEARRAEREAEREKAEQTERDEEEARRLRRQRRAEREKEKLVASKAKKTEVEQPQQEPRDAARRAAEEDDEVAPPSPVSPRGLTRRNTVRERLQEPPSSQQRTRRNSLLSGLSLFGRSKTEPVVPTSKSIKPVARVKTDPVEKERSSSSRQSSGDSRERAERPHRPRRPSHSHHHRTFRSAEEEVDYRRKKEERRASRTVKERDLEMSGGRDGGISLANPEPVLEPMPEVEPEQPRSPLINEAAAVVGVGSTSSAERRERRRQSKRVSIAEHGQPRSRRISVVEKERPVSRRVQTNRPVSREAETDRPRTKHGEDRPKGPRRSDTNRSGHHGDSRKKKDEGGLFVPIRYVSGYIRCALHCWEVFGWGGILYKYDFRDMASFIAASAARFLYSASLTLAFQDVYIVLFFCEYYYHDLMNSFQLFSLPHPPGLALCVILCCGNPAPLDEKKSKTPSTLRLATRNTSNYLEQKGGMEKSQSNSNFVVAVVDQTALVIWLNVWLVRDFPVERFWRLFGFYRQRKDFGREHMGKWVGKRQEGQEVQKRLPKRLGFSLTPLEIRFRMAGRAYENKPAGPEHGQSGGRVLFWYGASGAATLCGEAQAPVQNGLAWLQFTHAITLHLIPVPLLSNHLAFIATNLVFGIANSLASFEEVLLKAQRLTIMLFEMQNGTKIEMFNNRNAENTSNYFVQRRLWWSDDISGGNGGLSLLHLGKPTRSSVCEDLIRIDIVTCCTKKTLGRHALAKFKPSTLTRSYGILMPAELTAHLEMSSSNIILFEMKKYRNRVEEVTSSLENHLQPLGEPTCSAGSGQISIHNPIIQKQQSSRTPFTYPN
ncbi:uncharacterized protein BDR25DRAFT_391492 [Lindgomyces ingoldianus]|uniref:Uncharacterized protein n=1 Tax=Lindgomyces ingoldianus TaxID=673940 RepID=A0ACB6R965_9PLEO|nr:uncharacterized protein BDR25DRAFT_391492 [Lindgomyces ingoldianus]KAF2475285.1 hypothetical protein BDR25DRAFT_391492 [Lindgomyces ingoldianus]